MYSHFYLENSALRTRSNHTIGLKRYFAQTALDSNQSIDITAKLLFNTCV
jgi:hypothetical protein